MAEQCTPILPRGTFVPFDKTDIEQSIPARFRAQVRHHGDRLAVKFGAQAWSYRTLDELSSQIAHVILDRRDDIEEPVLLLLGQGAGLIGSVLGALKAGKMYVPQSASSNIETIRRVLTDCAAPLIVTDAENRELAQQLAGRGRDVLDIDRLAADLPSIDPDLDLSPGRAAYIYYTSGSTGTPKGVVDCHRNVLHNIMRYTNSLAIGVDDRLSLVQMPAFSGAVSSMFCAVLNGASVFPFDLARSGIRGLADRVNAEQLTMFHAVPAIFEQMATLAVPFPTLRVIRLEGDRAAAKHLQLFKRGADAACWLVNGLGTTETGLVRQYFYNPSMPVPDHAVPIGYPVADMDVVLLGDLGKPVEAGAAGEISVRSEYLAVGYWSHRGLTDLRAETRPPTYRTGDLGRLTPDGCLFHLGRKDFQIRIRGQHIDPSMVEAALLSVESIQDAAVAAHTGRQGRQRLVAYIVMASEARLSVASLRRELAESLPPNAIPSSFVMLDALPLDENRKVMRRRLPPPGRERPPLDIPLIHPTTALQRTLVNEFKHILELDAVGIDDDFFDLGGDSLLLIRLVLFLEETFATTIPSELFFDDLSVAKIADWRQASISSQIVVPLRCDGTLPPLFLFHDYAGHVLDYAHLAAGLRDARPVYGLQRCGTRTDSVLLPELAARYVEEIRNIQPQGPYLLGGQCFGGLLAFEAAHQLRSLGGYVQHVVLMDTAFPRSWLRRLGQRMSPRRHWRRMAGLPPRQMARYVVARLRNGLRSVITTFVRGLHRPLGRAMGVATNLPAALQRPTDAHRFAEARYRAMPYDGTVTLICVGPRHNQRGWEAVVNDRFEAVELPVTAKRQSADHPTAPAYMTALVRVLDRVLGDPQSADERPTCKAANDRFDT